MLLPPIYTTLKNNALVSAVVGTRIFRHGDAPQDVTKPYITWFLVTGTPENNLSQTPPSDRLSCQVDCWHPTDLGIEDLAEKVRNALETIGHVTGIIVDERDAETRLYRVSFQIDVWQNRNL